MARLFTDGAESNDILFWDLTGAAFGGLYTHTEVARSGLYAYKFDKYPWARKLISPGFTELYFRLGFYARSISANKTWFSWYGNDPNTKLGRVFLQNDYKLKAVVGTTEVASGTELVSVYAWHLLEVHVKIADSGGVIQVKIDGVLDIDYEGDTKSGSETEIKGFEFYFDSTVFIDDFAVNDTSGAVDNSWCGDGHVIALKPNSSGDSSDFVGSDSDSVDNYALVDDIPSDSDTTYVESATPDDCDLYNLEACGIDSDMYEIKRIFIEGRGKDTTTGSGIVTPLIKTSGSEIESDQVELTTTYAQIKSEEWVTNPMTGSAWTPTEVDALQIGIKVVQ